MKNSFYYYWKYWDSKKKDATEYYTMPLLRKDANNFTQSRESFKAIGEKAASLPAHKPVVSLQVFAS